MFREAENLLQVLQHMALVIEANCLTGPFKGSGFFLSLKERLKRWFLAKVQNHIKTRLVDN
ncbi:MAG: hypothetical protein CMI05_13640 [Oceanospirillaceae bacterium]|nr:hypothetical protein [Oceanospirillaceae bacterium]